MLTYADVCRYVWEKRFAQLQANRLCLVLTQQAATYAVCRGKSKRATYADVGMLTYARMLTYADVCS